MNKLDKQYTDLLQDILDNGVTKQDRTGTGTISVFGRQMRHDMKDGFPLLTTKKMPWKVIVTELLWFLRGDTNIKYLVDNGCNIWNGDAYKRYSNSTETSEYDGIGSTSIKLPTLTEEEFINKIKTDNEFAKRWGELGPIYGTGWRNWNSITKKWWSDPEYQGYGSDSRSGWEYNETQIDQIQNLINDLKTNPDSRRLMVNAWNVGELGQMVLPPCHYGFQVYTRELSYNERYEIHRKYITEDKLDLVLEFATNENLDKLGVPTRAISLMWNQRSVDTFLGLPFNIASYGLLLEIIAKMVNMVPGELIGNLGDVHLYSNHIEQAREQIGGPIDHEKRHKLLKEAMGNEAYENAIDELEAFGGGLSEYYDSYKIPYSTREPYQLPTLKMSNLIETDVKKYGTFANANLDMFISRLEATDFTIENYQSHPTIKAPLSN
jgi:thymidylate synthase